MTKDDLAEAVLTASRALLAIAVRSMQAATNPVTVAQHRVLVLLAAYGPLTITAIAARLAVDQSTASRHCAAVHVQGLVERSRAHADGRATIVTLTEAGRALLETVTEARLTEIRSILARMSPDEAASTLDGFRAFARAADELKDEDWALFR